MRPIIALLFLVTAISCGAQQAYFSYSTTADRDEALRVMVTPKLIRVVSEGGGAETKRSISDSEYLRITNSFMQIFVQELKVPVSTSAGEVSKATLLMHVFSADRTYSFSATPDSVKADEILAAVGVAIQIADLKDRTKAAQPGATDNPGGAQ